MKKRLLSITLICTILSSLVFTGCGTAGNPSLQESSGAMVSSAAAAEETGAAEAPVLSAPQELLTQFETVPAESVSDDAPEQQAVAPNVLFPCGMPEPAEETAPEKISADEGEKIERAMRDYSFDYSSYDPQAFPINAASYFYYYSHLDREIQEIYEAMYTVASNPYARDYDAIIETRDDPSSDDFYTKIRIARTALLYDHPEFFYLVPYCYDRSSPYGQLRYSYRQEGSHYKVYFHLQNIPSNLSKFIINFNQATSQFLSFVDWDRSQYEIAKDLHDLLIYNADYDDDTCDYDKYGDLAHTAYGAIVANSDGETRKAVCDGYSLAYTYLLQQAGISGIVISGYAGQDDASAGGHAWNMVQIDGSWYEVDATWDDIGSMLDDLPRDQYYNLAITAYNDPNYYEKATHSMFCLSTAQIRYFNPGDRYRYYGPNGSWYNFIGSSVHRRETTQDYYYLGYLMNTAPEAY